MTLRDRLTFWNCLAGLLAVWLYVLAAFYCLTWANGNAWLAPACFLGYALCKGLCLKANRRLQEIDDMENGTNS